MRLPLLCGLTCAWAAALAAPADDLVGKSVVVVGWTENRQQRIDRRPEVRSVGGGVRSVNVNGRAITLQANYGNYARNLQVEVAQGGGSCSAQMTVGKQAGSAPKAFKNTAGLTIEIHAVSVSGITCSMQQGNVFARN